MMRRASDIRINDRPMPLRTAKMGMLVDAPALCHCHPWILENAPRPEVSLHTNLPLHRHLPNIVEIRAQLSYALVKSWLRVSVVLEDAHYKFDAAAYSSQIAADVGAGVLHTPHRNAGPPWGRYKRGTSGGTRKSNRAKHKSHGSGPADSVNAGAARRAA